MGLEKRFSGFNLELHKDKTRLIEFGRFAAQNCRRQEKGKPETFDFLGFIHICGKNQNGKFTAYRHSIGKRIRAKLEQVKMELRRHLHRPIPEVGKWLRIVLLGHYRYCGLPETSRKLEAFMYHKSLPWYKTQIRRSQRKRFNWERMDRLINRWLPKPRIWHQYLDLSSFKELSTLLRPSPCCDACVICNRGSKYGWESMQEQKREGLAY